MIQVMPEQKVQRRVNLAMDLKFRAIADKRHSHRVGQLMIQHSYDVSRR